MNFDLKPHTILLTLAGSRAYGTNTFTSDVDLKGVCVPPKEFYLGTKRFDQADKPDTMGCFLNDLPFELEQSAVAYGMEGTVFEVRRFLALAAEANPNILDVLFCRDEDVLLSTPAGNLLRHHRHEFLTKKCLMTFFGYSKSQMDRIETARSYLLNKPTHKPTREEFGLPERHEFPQDQVMAAMSMIKKKVDGWNIDFVDIDEATKIFVQDQIYQMLAELHLGSDERFFVAAKLLGYDTNFMDFIRKQREYDQAVKKWQAYQTWLAERNVKRAGMEAEIGYDCYSEDTEFLTDNGWKGYAAVTPSDSLATVHPDTGVLEFQHYVDRIEKPYTGRMAHIQGTHYDCKVTMGHQMLVSAAHRNKGNGFSIKFAAEHAKWSLVPLEDLVGGYRAHYHVRRVATPSNPDYNVTREYLILMGAYLSEGCVGRRSAEGEPLTLRFSQKEGNRLCKWMDELKQHFRKHMKEYAYDRKDKWRTTPCKEHVWDLRHPIAKRIVQDCGELSAHKRLPEWVMSLSQEQARLLLTVMLEGDGTTHGDGHVLYTNSKQLADGTQALCAASGFLSAVWGPYFSGGRKIPTHQIHMQIESGAEPKCLNFRGPGIKYEEVEGATVVCFTVPNGTLITRRNGKVAVQGNCKHGMHLARLVMACRTIFETGTLNVYNPDPWLLDIRNCKVPFDDLKAWYAEQRAGLAEIAAKSSLPARVDQEWLSDLAVSIVENRLA